MKKLLSFVLVLAAVAASAATYPNKFVTNATPENVAWTNTQGIAITSGGIRATGIVSKIEAGSANTLVVTNGRVGIGTNNPAAKVDVEGLFTINSGVTTWGTSASFGVLSYDTGVAIIGAQVGKDLVFRANNAERARLKSDGNLGIGTTSPGAKLTVQGDAIGTAITTTLSLTNATAAANGAQQNSPALMLGGAGYSTTGSTSAPVSMGFVTVPVQGTTPTARLTVVKSIGDAAASSTGVFIGDNGTLTTGGSINSGGSITIPSGGGVAWAGGRIFSGPANMLFLLDVTATSGATLLGFGPVTSENAASASTNWPAMRVLRNTNNITLGFMAGTNETQFVNVAAGALILDTNYVASRFTNNIAGTSRLVISNDVLYFVTRTKTNVVSDGR